MIHPLGTTNVSVRFKLPFLQLFRLGQSEGLTSFSPDNMDLSVTSSDPCLWYWEGIKKPGALCHFMFSLWRVFHQIFLRLKKETFICFFTDENTLLSNVYLRIETNEHRRQIAESRVSISVLNMLAGGLWAKHWDWGAVSPLGYCLVSAPPKIAFLIIW